MLKYMLTAIALLAGLGVSNGEDRKGKTLWLLTGQNPFAPPAPAVHHAAPAPQHPQPEAQHSSFLWRAVMKAMQFLINRASHRSEPIGRFQTRRVGPSQGFNRPGYRGRGGMIYGDYPMYGDYDYYF